MVTLPTAATAEILADIGFDWLFLDAEHGSLEYSDIQGILQAVGDRVACVVRLPAAAEVPIKKVLDLGAAGIIAPQVNTVEQAQDVVRFARYSPQGTRGVGLGRAHGYGMHFAEYLETANDHVAVLVQAEHIEAVENMESIVRVEGIEIQNYYIPAGGDEPDPDTNPRFAHKLDFVERLEAYVRERANEEADIVAVGDFNIAPHENDVWSHKQLLSVVSHTPVETEGLERVRAAGDFIDVARALHPEEEKIFTWWSYRNRDWRKSNRGRRLDHIWVSPELAPALAGAEILREARDWQKPSDHVPVTVTLDLPRV